MADLVIVDDNDYVEVVQIRGTSPVTGRREGYHIPDVVGFITDAPGSNTPIGSLTVAATEIEDTGHWSVTFDGGQITTSLAAKADGDVVYRVIRSPNNFRVVDPVTYKKTRPSDSGDCG